MEEENGTYGASGYFLYILEVLGGLCVCGLKCEIRYLFSCLHFQRISDFLFSRVFCDDCVMANFSWRQRRHFLMFCCRQVLVGEMFVSFSCHMYEDTEVLDAEFLYLKERLWLWILCYMVPSVAPM